jgi:hypothetical protein
MNDNSVIVVGVVIAGCCLFPFVCLLTGLFAGYRIGTKGLPSKSPTGVRAKSASGKFAVED